MARVFATLALAALIAAAGYPSAPAAAAKKAQTAKPGAASEAAGEQGEGKQKPVDPAEVEKSLAAAEKSLEAGKSDLAVQQLTALLSGARLQPRAMARALYLRGAAHRKQGKPAQAIADLTSALWLKSGLTDGDRTAALTARSEAYREAGLVDLADADARKVGKQPSTSTVASSSTLGRPAAAEPVGDKGTQETQARPATGAEQKPSSSGSGFSGIFSNLFGGPSTSGAGGSAKGAPSDAPAASQARQPTVGDAWSSTTTGATRASKRDADPPPAKEEPAVKLAATAKEGAKAEGRYRLQVATVRSRKEAQAVAARLKKDKPGLAGGKEPEVEETVLGNMGTFYKVRIGPFADAAELQALCPKLRGLGLDCLVVTD